MKIIVRFIFIKIIEIYQHTLSPDHGWFRGKYLGGYCKYTPTCSEYSKSAIMKYGTMRGVPKAVWRVLRCNPWSSGGYDPVETNTKFEARNSRQIINQK
jgi:putative membrane protein insertion efficiency factor